MAIPADETWLGRLTDLLDGLPGGLSPVIAIPPEHYPELVSCDWLDLEAIVFRADQQEGETPVLLELAIAEARGLCTLVSVADSRPGWLSGRIALAGRQARMHFRRDAGQAMPLVLGAVFLLVLGAVLLVAVGGAVTGKAKAQRAVDLSPLATASTN